MRLIHDDQLDDLHTWDRQERKDWLYDYITRPAEAYPVLARQRRLRAAITYALRWREHEARITAWWARQEPDGVVVQMGLFEERKAG